MPWIKFTDDFDYIPEDKPMVTIAYKRGDVKNVPTPAAEKALELKVGVKTKRPAKTETTGGEDASRDT